MELYHGTDMVSAYDIISNGVNLNKSKSCLDFGRGFYLSDDYAAAQKWASRDSTVVGVVLAFSMVFDGLRVKTYASADSSWGEEVYQNRFSNVESGVDCIIGPIADGRMYYLIPKVSSGRMSQLEFVAAIKPTLTCIQYVLKTQKAITNLTLVRKDVMK